MSNPHPPWGPNGRPWVDPPNHNVGPGPLSPAWPKPPAPRSPALNEWDGLAGDFLDLRRALLASLADPRGTAPLMLSLDERAGLEEKFARLKAGNAALPRWSRSAEIAGWPTPVLATSILYGARDIADVLGDAITLAHTLATESGRWHPDAPAEPGPDASAFPAALSAPATPPEPAIDSPSDDAKEPESPPGPQLLGKHPSEAETPPDDSPAAPPAVASAITSEMIVELCYTSPRLVALYEAVHPALAALIGTVAPLATRRPAAPVPAAVVAEARRVLFDVRKIVSREPLFRGRLDLGPAADWASLAAKLALARVALAAFRSRYYEVDVATLSGFWRAFDSTDFLARLTD